MKRSLAGLFLFVLGLNAQIYRTYVYVSTPLNWTQAYKYCKTYYTDLSAITSQEQNQQMLASSGVGFDKAWIGLHKTTGKPNSLAWTTEESFIFTKLYNIDKVYSCAYATETEWYMAYCLNVLPFFCHIDYYLWLVTANMAWEDALDFCRHWYTDLASSTDQYQWEILQDRSKASTTESVWTGLRFLEGEWYWVSITFTYIPFRTWMPSCPEEPYRCGALNNQTAQWEIRDCEEKLNFFCYQLK
ncbi:L-selectin-like [Puntigrus tetrazona]|uniref:L-selectin-like n=1 Tax=Puntigrus tetrazona TaxID=1606681 RepID=UPI001C8ADA02|nr:L-selectin-like [Puntigrus tetrazona]